MEVIPITSIFTLILKNTYKVITLDFLIPQYDDADDVIKCLLNSTALQQNIDFNNIRVML